MTTVEGRKNHLADALVRASYAQEQLWFLNQLTPGETAYNSTVGWRLKGPLSVSFLEAALSAVVARHDALRVSFEDVDGIPFQRVSPVGDVDLEFVDAALPDGSSVDDFMRRQLEELRDLPFDLDGGPLYRFRICRLGPDDHLFIQAYHHAVTDGWSAVIVNREIGEIYSSLVSRGTVPELAEPSSYLDFAQAQRARLDGPDLADDMVYWRERLAGLDAPEFPSDRPRPEGGDLRGSYFMVRLSRGADEGLADLADSCGVSEFMALSAVTVLLLSRCCDTDDIAIGIPMLGRADADVENTVGMFVNLVVLREKLSQGSTFRDLCEQVSENMFDLIDHQETPFPLIVDELAPNRVSGRNPLFQVCLQMLNESNSGESLEFTGVTSETLTTDSATSRFDISITALRSQDGVRVGVEYSSAMYDEWRMRDLVARLDTLLEAVSAKPDVDVDQVSALSVEEGARLAAAGHEFFKALPADVAAGAEGVALPLDRRGLVVPRGVYGELCIVDPSVWPATSSEPAASLVRVPSGEFVRTGVWARWNDDFLLEVREHQGRETLDGEPGEPAGLESSVVSTDGEMSEIERTVREIFEEVLETSQVGVDDNFFALGGSSLKAMRVVSRVNKFYGVKVKVKTMYQEPTVRAVASAVSGALA